jgi:hypothetical protein
MRYQQTALAQIDDKINALYDIRDAYPMSVQRYESDAQSLFYQIKNYGISIWKGTSHNDFMPCRDQTQNDAQNNLLYKTRAVYDAISAEINDLNYEKNETQGLMGQLSDLIDGCMYDLSVWYNDGNYS